MKNVFVLAFVAIVGLMSFSKPAPTTFKVDVAKSNLKWVGKKVTGQHYGSVKLSQGGLTFDNGNFVGGAFNINMTTIDVQDIPAAQGGDKLLGHLKSDDFFGTDKFTTATLIVKSVSAKGNNQYDVKADLTIKGVTNEVSFPATVTVAGGTATAVAKFAVDRTKYGIKYGSGSFFDNLGDKAISNEFEMEINLVADAPVAAPAAAAPAKKATKKAKKAATKN